MDKRYRFLIGLVTILSICVGIVGCNKLPQQGEREIILAAARDLAPGYKDPYFSTVILKTWEPLIAISDNGQVQAKLAERWENNSACTQWKFYLKKGVRFHDGVSFNADAVIQNFKRYTNMGYRPSPFYGFAIERVYPGFLRVEKIDDYTVILYFKKPVPMLIYRMAGWGSAMFSPACFNEKNGDFITIAKGTGPFQIIDRKGNEFALLERYDGYYGELAKAKRIRIRVIPAPETRYSAMKAGEIHGVIDLGGLPPILAEELLKDSRFAANSAKSTISHYLTLNGGKFPFNDERMRKALNLIIDREKITKYYFRGIGTPTMSFLNSTNPFAKVCPPYTDKAEAIRLAQEVLQGTRVAVRFLLPQYGMARYPYKVIAEFLQAEMKALGLDVEIVIADGMVQRKAMKKGDFDLFIGTRGLANLDPTSLLYEFFSSQGPINVANGIHYKNNTIDACFQKLEVTYDIEERTEIYKKIIEELLEHPAVIPLLEDQNLAVYNKNLKGYQAAVYGITLEQVQWADERNTGQ